MKAVSGISYRKYKACAPCVVALGCFDGVHLGHESVIREARRIADEMGLELTVWSFEEPPRNYFAPRSVPLLTDRNEKRARMRSLGADVFLSVPFDADIAGTSPTSFFEDILCEKLCARHLVCGFNFTFGARGAGNTALLRSMCEERGIGLTVMPPVTLGGKEVSSSSIRTAISNGEMRGAASQLGRPYSISATVVNGQHLATSLGFPTANQLFPEKKAVPAYGVYAVRVRLGRRRYFGITNIGMRPTVNGTLLCAETNIFELCEDLYGKQMTVELLHFIRPEKKFDSIDELAARVHEDIRHAKELLGCN